MIHEHLIMSGCFKTAETLRKEIEITPLVDPGQFRLTFHFFLSVHAK